MKLNIWKFFVLGRNTWNQETGRNIKIIIK